VEEAGSSGKVSLSEAVGLLEAVGLSCTEVGKLRGSEGQVLISRRVLGYAIKARSWVVPSKQVLPRQSRVLCMAGVVIAGAHGSGLSVPSWQVRSSSTPCSASRSGMGSLRALQVGPVSQSKGSAMLASSQASCRWSSCNQSIAGMVSCPGLPGSPGSGRLE